MAGTEFARFYEAVHGPGRKPFPWQDRLAALALDGHWPDTIAVPTGCGKTSVIDVAVFALAAQAGMLARERTARLRTFFVVDRRLVVDDVSRHAQKLAKAIEEKPELEWVRVQLKRFGGPRPLDTAVLRGGMYRSDTWADVPNQPLVCVSTVDQVGSRLLFRGYGVSDRRRPIDAGLVGSDALVIVDEAHLSKPFLDTLGWVERYQGETWRINRVAPGLRFVQMSATVSEKGESFKLDETDYSADDLRPRLEAEKLAELKECGSVPQEAVKEALRLANGGANVIGVVLNTVAAAREAYEALKEKPEAILLTGRIRPYDRDALVERYLERMKAGRTRVSGERLFVAATQTVEVGADLDFDALVTEAASLDSLRQRFGRLNRLGLAGEARAVILKAKRGKESDWIYGEALDETWKWLNEFATSEGGSRSIDFGVKRMGELVAREGRAGLTVEAEDGPLMFPAHVDAWAQTNLAPAADPGVAPFLHGAKALEAADVQIVWRADMQHADTEEDWISIVAAAPPLSTEALPLPFGAAMRWLARNDATVVDMEGVGADEEQEKAKREALIWRGEEKSTTKLESLRPGDTVVVRSNEGGCDDFGWTPGLDRAVVDIGDPCANARAEAGGGRYRIRVHPMVVFPKDPEKQKELRDVIARAEEEDTTEELKELVEVAPELAKAAAEVEWGRARPYTHGGVIVVSKKFGLKEKKKKSPWRELDETDEDDTGSLTTHVTLACHTAGVVENARIFAQKCGLEVTIEKAIAVAAERHDLGKCDERFQRLLSPLWATGDKFLAKNDGCSRREFRKRQIDSGYPKGARHEFASVALAEALGHWPEECDSELALHLIGTHHGNGRALPPVWIDHDYEVRAQVNGHEVAVRGAHRVSRLDSGWTDRYWAMTRKYGWWGLAYLEAILRRADCVRSREEQEERS